MEDILQRVVELNLINDEQPSLVIKKLNISYFKELNFLFFLIYRKTVCWENFLKILAFCVFFSTSLGCVWCWLLPWSRRFFKISISWTFLLPCHGCKSKPYEVIKKWCLDIRIWVPFAYTRHIFVFDGFFNFENFIYLNIRPGPWVRVKLKNVSEKCSWHK